MADRLGEERGQVMQNIVDKVFALFVPLARWEWLSWGGELLPPDLKEQVELEEEEKEEVKLREAKELEEMETREAEEEAKCVAAEAKVARLEAWKVVLGEAQRSVMADFWAETLSRDDLQQRSVELAAKACTIKKEEVGKEKEDEIEKETVEFRAASQVVAGKRKADKVEGDDGGEDKVDLK
jgi:hypothetical protein